MSIRGHISADCLILLGAAVSIAGAQPRPIDASKSVITVHVFKAGVLSALGHDHEIAANVSRGSVDAKAQTVELHIQTGSLQVRDVKGSDKDRSEIQQTMAGPEVLDVARYPEIAFRSTGAESSGDGSWTLHGNLTLHGQTHPVTVDVRDTNGHYVGSSRFKQTEFGITPVKVAGGSIRVKDEIRIEFDIQLAP